MLTNQNKLYTLLMLMLFTLLLSACQISLGEPGPTSTENSTTSSANVHLFGNSEMEVAGATSMLTRNTEGVALVLDTTDLTPGDAYTVWWVLFNNPAACATAPCKGSDLSNPETVGMVGYATGGVVEASGQAHFEATLTMGDNSIALDNGDGFPFELVEPAPGLINPMRAEIHAVVRTHGTALGDPTEQLTTFGGGCNPECTNVQAALHLPQTVAQK